MWRKIGITASVFFLMLAAIFVMSTEATIIGVTTKDSPEVLRIDDMEIEWEYASTAYAWTFDKNETKPRQVVDEPYCCALFRLTNKSDSKTYEFTGWSFGRNIPWAHDELGNTYAAAFFLPGTRVYAGNGIGVHEKLTLKPKQWLYITVPFERPVSSAKTLTFDLPAKAFDLQGVFRIKGEIDADTRIERPLGWNASIPARSRAPRTPFAITR